MSPVSCLLPLAASHTTIVKSNDTASTISLLAFFLTMSYEYFENYDNMLFLLLVAGAGAAAATTTASSGL